MKKFMLYLGLIFAISTAALAQTPSQATTGAASQNSLTDEVDKIFAEYDKPNSPGCAVAIIQDGRIVYKRSYGMANLDYDIPITSESVFCMGSTTKQFTAACIVLLAQKGVISLDDDIRKYVPEIPQYGSTITIRHLIHHTSGVRDLYELMDLAGDSFEERSTEDAIQMIARQKELNFKPGERYLYSNTGYLLLAEIVKRASGKSLREFAEENIFRPLGMSNSHFDDDYTMIVKNRVTSYRPEAGEGFRLYFLNWNIFGSGNLLTTVEDLYRWDQNFYDNKLGGSGFVEQMLTRGKLNDGEELHYAFGLVYEEYKGMKAVGHRGAFLGFRTGMIRFPEQRVTAICLCNVSTAPPDDFAKRAIEIYLADQLKQQTGSKPVTTETASVKLSEQDIVAKAGVYWNSKIEEARRLYLKDGKPVSAGSALSPLGKDRFKVLGLPIELTFVLPRQGSPLQLHETAYGGKPVIYETIQVVAPTSAQLAEYAGTYYSEEIAATYKLIIQEGKLVLPRQRVEDRPLLPMFADAFMNDALGNIRFTRDEQNLVSGFRLNSTRVKHLWFAKGRR